MYIFYVYRNKKSQNIYSELFVFVGLRYRPKQPDNFADSTLISFDRDNYTMWTKIIDDFIKRMAPVVYCDYAG
jgi:hypothetical protein